MTEALQRAILPWRVRLQQSSTEEKIMNDTGRSTSPAPVTDRHSLCWLAIACGLLAFSNGARIVPLAAWLGPLFLVRFLRTQKAGRGLLAGYLVTAGLFYFQWYSAFQDAGAAFALYTAVFGLIAFVPYVADRLLWPHMKGFSATLILPVAWVACEYLLHLVLPLGTFFSIAYTQHGNLPLLQLLSVTGLWGVTFLVTWAAGVANYAWERGFSVQQAGRGLAVYGLALGLVLFFGGLRLAIAPPRSYTVQVSVLTTNLDEEVIPEWGEERERRLAAGSLNTEDRQALEGIMKATNENLWHRSRLEAQAGSKIVVWNEYDAHVFQDHEQAFLQHSRDLAREEGIYLAMPLIVLIADPAQRPQPERFVENKLVLITPAGEIGFQYRKANLLIGWEAEYAIRGPRTIRWVDSPYGRLAGVICLDMDYPSFMRQAGQAGVDIVLSGAIDGTASTKDNPLHAIMASFRAIESGFSLARGGKYGQSLLVDYQGHILGTARHQTADGRTAVGHVPTQGVQTLYALVGDLFAWLCLLGLLGLVVVAVHRARTA
jgi:apolipoprotein N-acyltransferase